MQILVRNIFSGDFLDDNGGWTKDLQKAKNFAKTCHALEAAANLDASQLEVLFFIDDPVLKAPIPLNSITRPKGFARMSGAEVPENQAPYTRMDMMLVRAPQPLQSKGTN